MSTHLICKKKC